jgi:hypothetical protein
MKRPEGVSLVALYFFAMSIPSLIGACCLLTGMVTAGFSIQEIDFSAGVGITTGTIALILAFGLGILLFITGLGLWGMRMWARWLAVGISILSLFAFPIGTVIGVVTIWYLFRESTKDAFEAAGKPEESLLDEVVDEMEELLEPIESDEPEEAKEPDQPEELEDGAAPEEPEDSVESVEPDDSPAAEEPGAGKE